jgi:putative ABC transport system permease protein
VRLPMPSQPGARFAQYHAVMDSFRAHPGVVAVSAVDVPPSAGEMPVTVTDTEGRPFVKRRVFQGYFEVMRTPLLAGRTFTEAELRSSGPVAIMNASAVRQSWPDTPVDRTLGRELRLKGDGPRALVGIVADTRSRHAVAAQPELFVPAAPDLPFPPTFMLRAANRTAPDVLALRTVFRRDYGPSATLTVTSVSKQLEPWLQDPKLYAQVFGVFGLVGLILSAVGLFALTSFEASLRQYEIGVRLSLGATSKQIEYMLVRQAVSPVAAGVALGMIGAFWAARVFQSLLHNVDARGLGMYAAVATLLLFTAAVSAWRPARQAGQTDPIIVLKAQ